MTNEDCVVCMEYLTEMGVVCIVTKKGEVMTCNTITYEVWNSVLEGSMGLCLFSRLKLWAMLVMGLSKWHGVLIKI